jgi:hypothetical protein
MGGKERNQAASVPWSEMQNAIQANTQKSISLQGGSASTSVTSIPADAMVSWLPGWSEDTSATITDGISLSLWIRDPLFRIAAPNIRRSMEMEEASFLLHESERAWKQFNGKARGWVRKHLEEDMRVRAGGGDPPHDTWETVRTTKRSSLLLDYICIVRSLRVALWWPDHKAVTVVPLTGSTAPVTQLNCLAGRILLGPTSEATIPGVAWPALLLTASSDFVWAPPASAASIGSQTVSQIQDRINVIQPEGAGTTTGRTALWNRLMWLTLVSSLQGTKVEA